MFRIVTGMVTAVFSIVDLADASDEAFSSSTMLKLSRITGPHIILIVRISRQMMFPNYLIHLNQENMSFAGYGKIEQALVSNIPFTPSGLPNRTNMRCNSIPPFYLYPKFLELNSRRSNYRLDTRYCKNSALFPSAH